MLYRALLITAVIVSLGVVLLEISFRYYPDLRPMQTQAEIKTAAHQNATDDWFVPDAELGFLVAPARHKKLTSPDYVYVSETDSNGFPNREPWPERVDIVFLGDSLITGTGVGIDGQFTTLFDRKYPGIEVLNLGLPGASPEHQLRIFQRYGSRLPPSLVVAVLYVASDLDNAVRFSGWLETGMDQDYNDYRLSYRINQQRQESKEQGLRSELKRNIRRLTVIGEMKYVVSLLTGNQIDSFRYSDGSEVLLSLNTQKKLAGGLNQDQFEGIEGAFFEPIRNLAAEAQNQHAKLVVLLVPSKEEIFAQRSFPDVLTTKKQVRKKLADMGFAVIDPYERIYTEAQVRTPYFAVDAHLNGFGNEILADEFARWLEGSGLSVPAVASTEEASE